MADLARCQGLVKRGDVDQFTAIVVEQHIAADQARIRKPLGLRVLLA